MSRAVFRVTLPVFLILFAFAFNAAGAPPGAAKTGAVRGEVSDSLGAPVPGARVTLLSGGKTWGQTAAGPHGEFQWINIPPGQYRLSAGAPGFTPYSSASFEVRAGTTASIPVTLSVGLVREHTVVSATGWAVPASQVGAQVGVISHSELAALNKLDALDALRLLPGVNVAQEGERGAVTSVYIRGGNADFNKVLVDGIPVNEIGGVFDFSTLAASGVDEIEVFQGPNSILYGSDSLAGVVQITTRHGSTPVPQITYSVDGGNFGSLRQEASIGGIGGGFLRRFDYFSDFMRYDTGNSLPNSSFHNATYDGNFGWEPSGRSSLRFTVHHDALGLGSPNALAVYGIADTSFQRQQDTYLGLTAQDQTTSRWSNLLRLTSSELHYNFTTPSPAGIPFEGNYLGLPVSFCGANGTCASGQAILNFGGVYPNLYQAPSTVRSLRAQTNYSFLPQLSLTGGFVYTHESGFTESTGSSRENGIRDNYDSYVEARSSFAGRAFASAGVGFEQNAVFGFAATPRVSLAYYLRRPTSASIWGRTKVRFNFGEGIQEPSIFDVGSSLYSVLSGLSAGPGLIHQYQVSPIGAERSRDYDVGIEQGLWNERARVDLSLFRERFYDLIDFVPATALPTLGVPGPVAAAIPFGADVNSDSYRSQGVEAGLDLRLVRNVTFKASATYLDATVTRSFSSDALSPSFNPAYPSVPIGVFAPLVGARPFRRPPYSGNIVLTYARRRFGVNLNGYFVSRSDDSTTLTDLNFGNTLILPNHNLLAGYQLLDFSGWLDVRHGVKLFTTASNLLSEHYQAAFGYPALPFTFRAGVRFTLGGRR